ncbi:hypothetical protein MY04_3077 [Flammeovirga sp. MY04]|uniref:hypothetical protein n=1 Tax=Flammeovirga sp. MY04 TaxID=1191459 RepID=UPI0008061622|nr:hypothetical protein [Flammeovirga sp. MY04]ANQ50445.1 hypothetical protein MY04_3077 [Flammeovirga sp. MY04]
MKRASLWGECDAILAATSYPKSEVTKLIPKEIGLSEQTLTPEGEHPIVFMFNTQKIHIFFSFFTMRYYEMIPLVPYVHFKNNPTVNYQMSPILYVNSFLIVLGGQLMWHINKVLGKFKVPLPISDFPKVKHYSEKVFRKHIEAIEMNAEADGDTGVISDFPNAEKLRELWHTNAIVNNDTTFWTAQYQVTDKEVQPAKVAIDLKDIDGLPSEKMEIPSIKNTILGGLRLKFDWKLWWPKKYNATYSAPKEEIVTKEVLVD